MSRAKRKPETMVMGSGLKPFYVTECPSCHKTYWRLHPVMYITCKYCGARYMTSDAMEKRQDRQEEIKSLQEVT